MKIFQLLVLLIVCATIIIPLFNNIYRNNMWIYIKERLKEEKKMNDMRENLYKYKSKKK